MPIDIKRSQKISPAKQSLNEFGGMINRSIIQPVGKALAYPGQVIAGTFNQAALGLQNLPQNIRDYDKSYNENFVRMRKEGTIGGLKGPNFAPGALQNQPEVVQQKIRESEQRKQEQEQATLDTGIGGTEKIKRPNLISEQQNNNDGGRQLPGSEFLPKGNKLPSQPVIGDGGVPEFDNQYVQRNYAGLNNRTKNEEQFERNRTDRAKQDAAASAAAQSINRGTDAMAELRQLRSGVQDGSGPIISSGLPGPGESNGYKPIRPSGLGRAESINRANRASDERIVGVNNRQRSQQNLARLAARNTTQQEVTGLPKALSRGDQIEGFNQAKKFGQDFTSAIVPGLPPIVGEEVFNLISDDIPLTTIQASLDAVLTKLKLDGADPADIANDPAEIVSLLKERLRNE